MATGVRTFSCSMWQELDRRPAGAAFGWVRVQGKEVALVAYRGPEAGRKLGEDFGCVGALEPPHPCGYVTPHLVREVVEGSVDVILREKVVHVRDFLADGAVVAEVIALVLRDHDPGVSGDVAS